jgi:hypothetical protein
MRIRPRSRHSTSAHRPQPAVSTREVGCAPWPGPNRQVDSGQGNGLYFRPTRRGARGGVLPEPLAARCGLLLPAGCAVVGALLRCPLPLDLLRSLLVVSSLFPSGVFRSRVIAPPMDDGCLWLFAVLDVQFAALCSDTQLLFCCFVGYPERICLATPRFFGVFRPSPPRTRTPARPMSKGHFLRGEKKRRTYLPIFFEIF